MSNKFVFLYFILGALYFVTSCSRSPAPGGPSAQVSPPTTTKISSESVVTASVEPVQIAAGGTGQATVLITVQKGYHINSNPPTYPYLKATEVDVPNTEGIVVDYIYYPNPITKKFSFAEKPLNVYEGQTPITVALNAAKSTTKGQRSLSGTLRIQACDDQVCYPPGSIGITIPVTIK